MSVFDHASRSPDGLALDDGTRRRTWAELADRATRVGRLLRHELGVAPGEHAAYLMHNRAECVEVLLGALVAGVWITPVSRHLVPEEVAYVLRDSGARAVFTDAEHEGIVRAAGAEQVILAGADLDARLAAASDAPFGGDEPAGGTMMYTSGTSGRPKGVKRARPPTVEAALAAQGKLGAAIGLDGSGPHLVTGPLYHAAPLLFAVYDQANGAPMVILPRFDERATLRALAERGIRHTHMVPTMFVRLLRLPEAEREAFRAPALDLVLHGAAPISPEVKRRMIEWWGPVLVEYWGATESGVCTLVGSQEWLERPGTVGRPLPAYEVFAGDERGNPLPPGEEGLLWSRHRTVERVFEYHEAPEKTAESHPQPGLLTLGDVGWVDEDGYVYLCDRRAHTIISGGVNIYPAEVERVLQAHPAVADVAVFGVPDDEWGEQVKAAVELAPGFAPGPALEAELLEHARRHLAGYKVPRSVDFEEKLPRHPTGKLQVRHLRERYWAGRERRI